MTKKSKTDIHAEAPKIEELSNDDLDQVQGAGIPVEERPSLDHIGNFNYKIEIEGVTQGALKPRTSPTQLRKTK